jgi:hypothetical protein
MKSLIACVLILFGVLLASLPACAREPATAPAEFTNQLIGEKSPYLLQHAHNPVDWYPWGEEAFAKSRKEEQAYVSFRWLVHLPLVPRDVSASPSLIRRSRLT